ncbi:MAG: hypothetical protein R3E08_00240 [Thiotrichaceae bacterium]
MELHATEEVNSDLEGTRIVREGLRYFLILPQRKSVLMSENQRLGAVALDPGVRTFVTFYSEELHGKVGEGDFQIYHSFLNLDKLYPKISKALRQQKRNMKSR